MNDPEIDQAILRVQAGSIEDYQRVVVAYHRRLRTWLSGFCPPGKVRLPLVRTKAPSPLRSAGALQKLAQARWRD